MCYNYSERNVSCAMRVLIKIYNIDLYRMFSKEVGFKSIGWKQAPIQVYVRDVWVE